MTIGTILDYIYGSTTYYIHSLWFGGIIDNHGVVETTPLKCRYKGMYRQTVLLVTLN